MERGASQTVESSQAGAGAGAGAPPPAASDPPPTSPLAHTAGLLGGALAAAVSDIAAGAGSAGLARAFEPAEHASGEDSDYELDDGYEQVPAAACGAGLAACAAAGWFV